MMNQSKDATNQERQSVLAALPFIIHHSTFII
jgi:hypothetical protein